MTTIDTTDFSPIERLTYAVNKIEKQAAMDDADTTLFYAKFAIDAALKNYDQANEHAADRIAGYMYDWSLLSDLVGAEATLAIWFDVLAYGSTSKEADGLEITRDAITEMAKRAARDLLSNRYSGSSSDSMSNAIDAIKATAAARFVEAFGKDLTIAEVTAF